MASTDFKRLIARAVASGARTSDLARAHGYTDRGMRKLIAGADVQRFLAEARAELAEQSRAHLAAAARRGLENVVRILEDPSHPKHAEISWRVVDRTYFPRPDGAQVHVQVGAPTPAPVPPEVLRDLVRALDAAEARQGLRHFDLDNDPHLLDRADSRALPSPAGHRLLGPGGSDPFPAVPAHAGTNGAGQGSYGPPRVMPPTKMVPLRRVTRPAQPAAPQEAASPKPAPVVTPSPAPAPTAQGRVSAGDEPEGRGARWYPIPYPRRSERDT